MSWWKIRLALRMLMHDIETNEAAEVEPAATAAGGDCKVPIAAAYEAQNMPPEAFPEPPLEEEPEDRALTPPIGGSAAPTETIKPVRPKAAAKQKTARTRKGGAK